MGTEINEVIEFLFSHAVPRGIVRADDDDGTRSLIDALVERPEIKCPFAGTILEEDFAKHDGFEGAEAVEKGIGRAEGNDFVLWLADELDQGANGFACRGKQLDIRRVGRGTKGCVITSNGLPRRKQSLWGGFVGGFDGVLERIGGGDDAGKSNARCVADTQINSVLTLLGSTECRPGFMAGVWFEVIEGWGAAVGKEGGR